MLISESVGVWIGSVVMKLRVVTSSLAVVLSKLLETMETSRSSGFVVSIPIKVESVVLSNHDALVSSKIFKQNNKICLVLVRLNCLQV